MIKKLNRKHKEFLSNQGINHHRYLFVSEGADYYRFIDKLSKQTFDIRR